MKEHVISVRLTDEEWKFMQRWSANSGKKVSDLLREMIEDSRNARSVNVTSGYATMRE